MNTASQFVQPWRIDNATANFATGTVASPELIGTGIKWQMAVLHNNTRTDLSVRCDPGYNGPWRCEAEVKFFVCMINGCRYPVHTFKNVFADGNVFDDWCRVNTSYLWSNFANPQATLFSGDVVYLEFHIKIIAMNKFVRPLPALIADSARFTVPDELTDVILAIGDKKLHVSKQYLSIHSPIFTAMFLRNFAEKNKDEVELKEIVYEDFVELLHIIYPGDVAIHDFNILGVMALADRYQMESIITQAEKHLKRSKWFSAAEKLQLSDEYRMKELRDYCIQSYSTALELANLQLAPEYANLTDGTKAAICDQLMKLVRGTK